MCNSQRSSGWERNFLIEILQRANDLFCNIGYWKNCYQQMYLLRVRWECLL